MKITFAVIAIIILFPAYIPFIVEAQAPTPPDVPTLGPVITLSNEVPVRILSPENSSYYSNPVQLAFAIQATGLFGQFGNVGYQIDNGVINSTTNYGKSVVTATNVPAPGDFYKTTTAQGTIELPSLSEGVHKVTVYYGWQYLGLPENPSLQRFEVLGYSSAVFTVGPNIETQSNTPSLNSTTTTQDTNSSNFTISMVASINNYSSTCVFGVNTNSSMTYNSKYDSTKHPTQNQVFVLIFTSLIKLLLLRSSCPNTLFHLMEAMFGD